MSVWFFFSACRLLLTFIPLLSRIGRDSIDFGRLHSIYVALCHTYFEWARCNRLTCSFISFSLNSFKIKSHMPSKLDYSFHTTIYQYQSRATNCYRRSDVYFLALLQIVFCSYHIQYLCCKLLLHTRILSMTIMRFILAYGFCVGEAIILANVYLSLLFYKFLPVSPFLSQFMLAPKITQVRLVFLQATMCQY